MNKELETVKFIRNNNDWREKLTIAPYCLHLNEDDNFVLLKYDQVESDFQEEIVKECRGLIIDKNTIEPIALSFYKFFNIQEPNAARIYWKDCKVLEKVDGSKMLVWFNKYKDQWQVSTSSQLDAKNSPVGDFGISFFDLFNKALIGCLFPNYVSLFDYLSKNCCYTFELVSPESRVVVPYKKTDLYFIGCRDIETFEEIDPSTTDLYRFMKKPKQYNLSSVKACMDAVEKMGFDEEGFVVVDKYWNRVKIKSPAYVAAHHLKDNGRVNRDRVLEIIERGETDEFLGYFPEYKEYFDEISFARECFFSKLGLAIDDINNDKLAAKEYAKQNYILDFKINRKEFALKIMEKYKDISSFLFTFLDTNLLEYFCKTQWSKLTSDKKMEYINKIIEERRDI